MGFAVQMYFDRQTEARLRDLWEALARAGVNSHMIDVGARPHVSLAIFPRVGIDSLRPAMEDFARRTPPLAVRLTSVGSFPGQEGVVFLSPLASDGLLGTHRRYHECLARLDAQPDPRYLPGLWVPHCTVAVHAGPHEVAEAVRICLASDVFGPGRFEQIGLVEYGGGEKTRFLYTFPLGGPGADHASGQRAASAPSELVLETERLLLRPTHAEDVDDVFEYMSDPEVMRYRPCGVQTYEQVAMWVARMAAAAADAPFIGRVHQVVYKATGRVIGYCYLDHAWPEGYVEVLQGRTQPLVEITYGIARAYWRRGYATEAAKAMIAHGFRSLGLEEIVAAVHPANVASVAILERIGMTWRRHILWRGHERAHYYSITRQEYERLRSE